jgi:hypothetical protein
MRGFYFENHNNLQILSGMGHNLIGHLDLGAGSYLVWGKLSLGVNATGYPQAPWPYAIGVASLVLGGADDIASFGVKPDSAENNAICNLMCAATVTQSRRARLYLINLYPLPIYCHHIKLMALQVDTLAESEVGEHRPEAPEERLRDAVIKASSQNRTLIGDLLDPK